VPAKSQPAKSQPAKSQPAKSQPAKSQPAKSQPAKRTPKPAAAAEALDPRLEAIAKIYRGKPGITVGKLFASYGLKVDGKIFVMVVKGKLVLKLPKSRVDELVASKAGKHFEPGPGRVMKEWIAMTANDVDPVTLAREAYEFVRG
jgi:hypothetical protein